MATKDGLAQIWYADANGVITGNTPTADNVANAIIEGYNEHFGTSINIWTPETKTLQVGDTVPSWNAYEKIEMSSRKIALNIQATSPIYIFGVIENDILHLDVDEKEASWLAHFEGDVVEQKGPGIAAKSYLMGLFNQHGISLTDIVANIMQYEQGQIVPDWSDYEKIG